MDFISELKWRGLFFDSSNGVEELFKEGTQSGYIGFDPTAASLHIGSLLPILCLARLQRAGHRPIAIVGGGTGMVGDPSGKTAERTLMTLDQIEENVRGIRGQLERFLDFGSGATDAMLLNNADWLRPINFLEFMRDIGKHFTVNQMIGKESVRRRLESEQGISFTEFCYQLLQAYDFLELYDRHGCRLQLGGSDQWGNITAGMDLIHRLRGGKAHGITFPLVKTASGVKFGKTEAGTIWLDAGLTSPYRFYQFWINVDDADAGAYLRSFTWHTQEEIEAIEAEHAQAPERRTAQRALAKSVTEQVHGPTELEKAIMASEVIFGGSLESLPHDVIEAIAGDAPNTAVPKDRLGELTILDALVETGLATSRGQAKQLLSGGGIYVNNHAVQEAGHPIAGTDLLADQFVFLRKGKKTVHILNFS